MEAERKSFVFSRGQIKWPESVDGKTQKKDFAAKDFVIIDVNGKPIKGRIAQTSSK